MNQPSVALALNSFQYYIQGQIFYDLKHKKSQNFNQITFILSTNYDQSLHTQWKMLKFSFFASSNQIFKLGSHEYDYIEEKNKQITVNLPLQKIQMSEMILQKSQFQVYISGLNISSIMTKNQISELKKQIDTYRKYSWSASIVRYLQQRVSSRQSFQMKLKRNHLDNIGISLVFGIGQAQKVSFLRVSYIIWSKQTTLKTFYNLNYQISSTQLKQKTYFPALEHSQLFFSGISTLNFNFWSDVFFQLSGQMKQHGQDNVIQFLVSQNQNKTATKTNFELGIIFFSKRQQQYCSDCLDGKIHYENYCVNKCPQDYILKLVDGSFYSCQKCDIFKGLVPNTQINQCQCAKQFYSRIDSEGDLICQKCHYSCLTCNNASSCLSCDDKHSHTGRVLNQTTKRCQCKQGYFQNVQNQNIKCQKCHQSCLTCTGNSQKDCITCPLGRIRSQDGRCLCPANFQLKNNLCVCEAPNFSFRNYCFKFLTQDSCGQNEQKVFKNGVQSCQCKLGYQKFKDSCVKCGKNSFVDPITGMCKCKLGSLQFENECFSCNSNQFFNKNSKKCQCFKGFFLDNSGKCIQCGKRQIFLKGQCRCIYNYYRNEQRVCVRCLQNSPNSECQPNMF